MIKQSKIRHIAIPLIAAIGGFGGLACSSPVAGEGKKSAILEGPHIVETTLVTAQPMVRERPYSGVVRASRRAELTFTLSGRVQKRAAAIGVQVKRGDVLAVLDRRPLRNALAAAKARQQTLRTRLEQGKRDTARATRLKAANAIGSEELEQTIAGRDTLTAQLAAADANVSEAARQLGEATLRAPFDGTIVEVAIEPGEFAQAGRPAVLLSGEDQAEVEIEVPESRRTELTIGDKAAIHFPLGGGLSATGHITNVGRASAGPGRLVKVILALPKQAEAAAGTTAEVVLTTTNANALAVPVAAVVAPNGARPALFEVSDDKAKLVDVELGDVVGDRVIVVRGIKPGAEVIVAGHANLISGEDVARAKQ